MPDTMKTTKKPRTVTTQAVRIGGTALVAALDFQRAHKCTLRQAVQALCCTLPLASSADPTIYCGACHLATPAEDWTRKSKRGVYVCPMCGDVARGAAKSTARAAVRSMRTPAGARRNGKGVKA